MSGSESISVAVLHGCYGRGVTDWTALSARASLASHRLIGWIYWDPHGIEGYAKLGVPNGFGYYVATRCAPLASAGASVVTAACYSIRGDFIALSLDMCRQHTTFEAAYEVRNDAVGRGLRDYAPGIESGLAPLAAKLWEAAESLPVSGRIMHAAHRTWPRTDDPLVSAWLALNCIREWRGDTHFAILAAHDISGVQAGLLHDAFLGYPGEWIPRSRGADDSQIADALDGLTARGLATNGRINEAGLALREDLERQTDRQSERAWRHLGADVTTSLCETIEPYASTFLARIDATAGENWMPAARDSRRRTQTS
ncbi:MAG: SCO6745 family protein [Actinomycetota bacterium]